MDELLFLLKGKSEDFINTLLAKKVVEKIEKKIASLTPSDKDKLIAALILKEFDLPEDVKGTIDEYVKTIVTETVSKEPKYKPTVPVAMGEVSGRVVKKEKVREGEKEEKESEKDKKAKKKEKPLRLSEL